MTFRANLEGGRRKKHAGTTGQPLNFREGEGGKESLIRGGLFWGKKRKLKQQAPLDELFHSRLHLNQRTRGSHAGNKKESSTGKSDEGGVDGACYYLGQKSVNNKGRA